MQELSGRQIIAGWDLTLVVSCLYNKMYFKQHFRVTIFDDRITKQKQNTVLMQVAVGTLYQSKTNIFLEVLWLSYEKNTNCKPYPHFKSGK